MFFKNSYINTLERNSMKKFMFHMKMLKWIHVLAQEKYLKVIKILISTREFCLFWHVSDTADVIDFHVNYEQVTMKYAKSKEIPTITTIPPYLF